MKFCALVLIFFFCHTQCRKTYVPLDKNANTAFINIESGGVRPAVNAPSKANVPNVGPSQAKPAAAPSQPVTPPPTVVKVAAPPSPTPKSIQPPQPQTQPKPVQPTPPKPTPTQPTLIKPVPVNPAPVANPASTPGPGSVKQLVNFYDSHGKGSPIRPYSYSQAVKQG